MSHSLVHYAVFVSNLVTISILTFSHLDARVKAPAEAEKYKAEILANATKMKTILEAEAQSEAIALKGDAEAYAIECLAKGGFQKRKMISIQIFH